MGYVMLESKHLQSIFSEFKPFLKFKDGKLSIREDDPRWPEILKHPLWGVEFAKVGDLPEVARKVQVLMNRSGSDRSNPDDTSRLVSERGTGGRKRRRPSSETEAGTPPDALAEIAKLRQENATLMRKLAASQKKKEPEPV